MKLTKDGLEKNLTNTDLVEKLIAEGWVAEGEQKTEKEEAPKRGKRKNDN